MEAVFLRMLATAAVVSAVLLALLFPARKWLEGRYSPEFRWTIWLGLALLLLVAPVQAAVGQRRQPLVTVKVPDRVITVEAAEIEWTVPAVWTETVEEVRPAASAPVGADAAGEQTPVSLPAAGKPAPAPVTFPTAGEPVKTARKLEFSLLTLCAWLWLAVSGGVLGCRAVQYCLVRKKLLRRSVLTGEKGRVPLRVLPGLDGPMTLGWLRPVIFLPEGETSPLALEHELTHIRRGDLWGKGLIFLACAFCWFDPLVWYMARVADADMEAACDARVVRGFSDREKRSYGELLLTSASTCKGIPLATRFGGGKEQMKARLTQLFHPGRAGRILAVVLLIAVTVCAFLVGCEKAPSPAPTPEAAVETAAPMPEAGAEAAAPAPTPDEGSVKLQFYAKSEWPAGSEDYSEVTLTKVEYDPERDVIGKGGEEVTLPVSPDVDLVIKGSVRHRTGTFQRNMFDFLAWPALRSTIYPGMDLILVETEDGTITSMEWLTNKGLGEEPPYDNETARQCYVDYLWKKLQDCGNGASSNWESADWYQFAVADVNGDGRDELVLLKDPGVMADMAGVILGYDPVTEGVFEELNEFPSFHFLPGGTVRADWSHNQGPGDSIWPYNLYRYVRTPPWNGAYIWVGAVYCEDKAVRDAQGNPWDPNGVDVSGCGTIYHLQLEQEGEYTAVDRETYLRWLRNWVDTEDVPELEIEYMPLTADNIAALRAAG